MLQVESKCIKVVVMQLLPTAKKAVPNPNLIFFGVHQTEPKLSRTGPPNL